MVAWWETNLHGSDPYFMGSRTRGVGCQGGFCAEGTRETLMHLPAWLELGNVSWKWPPNSLSIPPGTFTSRCTENTHEAKTDSISSNRQTHNWYYGNTLRSSLVLTLLPPSVTFLPSPCFSLHLKLIKSKNLMVNQENLIALHSYNTDNINKIWKYAKRCFRLLIAQYICSNCIKIGSDDKF